MDETSVHFSSATNEWPTPQPLFDALNAEFHFTIDVCATPENAKCSRFYTKVDNGLAQDWSDEIAWMNPPFGHPIKLWMKKALLSACHGAMVVCLVPSRTDTIWWHKYAMCADEIRLLNKRLQFIGADQKAPFPAALVVFRPRSDGAIQHVPVLKEFVVPGSRKKLIGRGLEPRQEKSRPKGEINGGSV